jgi:muramoyltetrapeptide carboxypeptidase
MYAHWVSSMIPRRLNDGDVVGVVSPSRPVTPDLQKKLEAGIGMLQNLGLKVRVGEHVHSNALTYAATPMEKADDINEMFRDREIGAIICSQGGNSANSCLPYLDWQLIGANPKIFMGMSDITVLLNAIHAKTGLVTFHGGDVMWGFGGSPERYELNEFKKRLYEAQIGPIPPARERRTVRSGQAKGKLLGGNLRCLLKLAGTPYFPDVAGSILFFEALNISSEGCHALFHQLRQMGVFDKIKGVLIGHVEGRQKRENSIQMESVLLEVTADMSFPILKTNDFGHNCPNTVLPVGTKVQFDADSKEIEITKPCVL